MRLPHCGVALHCAPCQLVRNIMAVSPDKEVILRSGRSEEQEEQPSCTSNRSHGEMGVQNARVVLRCAAAVQALRSLRDLQKFAREWLEEQNMDYDPSFHPKT